LGAASAIVRSGVTRRHLLAVLGPAQGANIDLLFRLFQRVEMGCGVAPAADVDALVGCDATDDLAEMRIGVGQIDAVHWGRSDRVGDYARNRPK
jgi:hypothetical protein